MHPLGNRLLPPKGPCIPAIRREWLMGNRCGVEGSLGFDMGREGQGKERGSFPKADREEHLSVVISQV